MSKDINIEKYENIQPLKNYPLLKSIKVLSTGKSYLKPYLFDVEVSLVSQNHDDELLLLFQEVFNIKITPTQGSFSDIFVDIMNISEAQIQDATYFVSGDEGYTFSFYCKSFIFYRGT